MQDYKLASLLVGLQNRPRFWKICFFVCGSNYKCVLKSLNRRNHYLGSVDTESLARIPPPPPHSSAAITRITGWTTKIPRSSGSWFRVLKAVISSG